MAITTKRSHYFKNHLFYSDGRIQCLQKKYFHANSKQWLDNPNYLKFVKPRRHPDHGKLFVSLNVPSDDPHKCKHKTIQLSQVIAQVFLPKNRHKTKVWFKDGNWDNHNADNLYWVNQGDLNFIQQRAGTRNMSKQAAIMRKSQKSTKPKACALYDRKHKRIGIFLSRTACASELNTSAGTISYAIVNKTILLKKYYAKNLTKAR